MWEGSAWGELFAESSRCEREKSKVGQERMYRAKWSDVCRRSCPAMARLIGEQLDTSPTLLDSNVEKHTRRQRHGKWRPRDSKSHGR